MASDGLKKFHLTIEWAFYRNLLDFDLGWEWLTVNNITQACDHQTNRTKILCFTKIYSASIAQFIHPNPQSTYHMKPGIQYPSII